MCIPLHKRDNGIPLIVVEYHSVSFSTIGPFNDISARLSGTVNGNLKYYSIPLNGTKNPKYHSKNYSGTIKIPLATIPPGAFKYHSNTIQKPMVFEWYLNAIFVWDLWCVSSYLTLLELVLYPEQDGWFICNKSVRITTLQVRY